MTDAQTARLVQGDVAPDFTLPDARGQQVSLSDYSGDKVIVYFYPRAMTPGCTTEACDFRDNLNRFAQDGYQVVGISPDPVDKLEKFTEKEDLNFPVLSDADHAVAETYGAWGEKKNYGKVTEGLIRSTIVVGPDGTVELAQYNVRAKGHVAKLRRDLGLD
ncbi:thioredoxin-dependent thiol peroxidase [Auritidibacter ignavus]|uniref:thioredoxin-dependent thiol peroxidase n=1 Tax=Auritidibacter ignavus TaxID=678932 RepID=UPI0024BB873F|nr:thioredoxin-dependent thiol peroxidase [Auritidibacter ignavus]WHS28249.1 thioredoxin-dependent thiol peroxidase [Auritidibacter ignavus]